MAMARWMGIGVLVSLAALSGCESKEAKLQKCKATCEKLNEEYLQKCTGPGADECKKRMNETLQTCNQTCEKAMQ